MSTLHLHMREGRLVRLEKLLTTDCYLVILKEGKNLVLRLYDFVADDFRSWRETFTTQENVELGFQRHIDAHNRRVTHLVETEYPLATLAAEALRRFG